MSWILLSIFLFFTFPVFIAGLLLNAVPFFLPKFIVKKKVKNPVFESTVRVVVGTFLFLFLYIFYFFLIPTFFELETFIQKISVGLCVVVFAYGTGLLSYSWYQLFKSVKGFFTLSFLNTDKQNEIIALHASCKEWLMKNLLV